MKDSEISPRYPGPISAAMLDELGKYVIATPYPFVLDLAKCEGMYLATMDGQRLFDWAGYFGSKLIGHNHPRCMNRSTRSVWSSPPTIKLRTRTS